MQTLAEGWTGLLAIRSSGSTTAEPWDINRSRAYWTGYLAYQKDAPNNLAVRFIRALLRSSRFCESRTAWPNSVTTLFSSRGSVLARSVASEFAPPRGFPVQEASVIAKAVTAAATPMTRMESPYTGFLSQFPFPKSTSQQHFRMLSLAHLMNSVLVESAEARALL
jgi:hypothetical protein